MPDGSDLWGHVETPGVRGACEGATWVNTASLD